MTTRQSWTGDVSVEDGVDRQLVRTPRTVLGPYFSLGMQLRSTVVSAGQELITIRGSVLDMFGNPTPMSIVETAQPEGWTRSYILMDGKYEIRVPKPAPMAGRAPHLSAWAAFASAIRPTVTCIYFEDEDNEGDELLALLSPEQRATMMARKTDDGYQFDFRLSGEGETVFLVGEGI
jgi:protocatechuate 3,4-dioxygenase, alpha subunit